MNKKLLLFIFLFISFTSSLFASFQVSYLNDSKKYKNINDVINKDFTSIPKKMTFGNKKDVWIKIRIENKTNKKIDNYSSINNIQIMENVHFYTILKNQVIQKNELFNKYKNYNVDHRIGNSLIYNNKINANQNLDVYIHITAKSHIYFDINNGIFSEITTKSSRTTTLLIFLVGALSALGIYYAFLYIFTPNSSYLYYTLFVFSLLFWSFYIYGGYAYHFDIFTVGGFSNTFVVLIPIFTIMFFKSIYKNYSEFYKYNLILNFFLSFLVLFLVLYILSQLDLIFYISIGKYGALIYLFTLIITMTISIIIYIKKLPYSGIFLLGYSANFIGTITTIGFFLGKTPYNIFTFHGNIIGGVIEAILFSILLTYKMRKVYKEKEDAINSSKIKNIKINILNETIDFISHQWRQPLSQINSSVFAIDNIANQNKLQIKKLDEELLYIESITSYMSSTIDDFRNLFSNNKKDEVFSLNSIITKTLSILKKVLINKNIELNLNIKEELMITGNKGDITQVLLIILNNAKDVLEERQILSPKINISLIKEDNKANLIISDNAGGISPKNEEKIFTANYSTKDNDKNSGLGLYIAKTLIENKMMGELSVSNDNQGACFCIKMQVVQ